MRHTILLLLLSVASILHATDNTTVAPTMQDDFVRASVLVASPGKAIYSALGHASLRLECPTYNLDYVFTYEGENLQHNIMAYLAGRLTMALYAVPTDSFLQTYRHEGRGVEAYTLHLPIAAKQRLWQQMDQRLQEPEIPYDYMAHGCATSLLEWIAAAVPADSMDYGEWPADMSRTPREICEDSIPSQWDIFLITHLVAGSGNDANLRPEQKIIAPRMLITTLRRTTAYGAPILEPGSTTVLKAQPASPVSRTNYPLIVALVLLIVALANLHLHCRAITLTIWAAQTMVGLFLGYLIFISDLPCTEWNWLFVPFCPLPLLLWHWRRYWSIPFASICILWVAGMLLAPHSLTTPAHIVLAIVLAVTAIEGRKNTAIY